jgi:pimeloyl-ACP methyl ester carboxylesterase
MRHRFCTLTLATALLAGCQATGPVATDAVPVKQLRANGVDLAYVEQGSGITVLFVHGASGDWRTWDTLRDAVSARYRFVSMSRRYHHPNPWADDGKLYSFDQQVDDVAAFIRALNVGKVHLVGSSYSGRLVGVVALKHPELLRSVVLGEPTLAAPTSDEGKAAAAAFGRDLGLAAAAARAGDDRKSAILVANAVLGDPDGFQKLAPVRQQRWLDNAKTMRPMFSGPVSAAVTCAQLKDLKVPAIVIRGERTRDSYRHGHDAVLGCLPAGTRAAVIPGATHFWGQDNPDAAAREILAFISQY